MRICHCCAVLLKGLAFPWQAKEKQSGEVRTVKVCPNCQEMILAGEMLARLDWDYLAPVEVREETIKPVVFGNRTLRPHREVL